MLKVRGVKCLSGGSEESLTFLMISSNKESCELCVKWKKPVTVDFL